MARIKFMNTEIDNYSMEETLERIDEIISENKEAYVVTPNVDHIVRLEKDGVFKEVYNNADLILADGKPLIWISKLYKNPIKEKVSGSDLFPVLCEMAAKKEYTMFFLGAAEGVAQKAATNLKEKYPNLWVVGTYSPPIGFEKDKDEMKKIIAMVRDASPHILIIGLGCPKQEKFIYKYRRELGVPISLCLGASIDFEAGNVKRAPRWMSNVGLEWFYRLCKEPRRMFKRYIVDDLEIIRLYFKYRK